MLGNVAPAAVDMAALAETAGPIGILEFNRVMIKNLPVVGPFPHFDTAHAVSADGMAFLHPVHHVEVMNVLFHDMVAADPDEVIPVPHLVFHLGQLSAVVLF